MGCRHLEEIYELYLLEARDSAEFDELADHLQRNCARCLEQMREAARMVYLLATNTPSARPNPERKSRLLRQLKTLKGAG